MTRGDTVTRDELLALIRDAFGNVTLGNGVTLREADVIDLYGTQDERIRARALDHQGAWWDIPDDDIEWHRPFSFLNDAGFAYYLPAYLTHAIRHDLRTNSTESVLFALSPFNLVQNTNLITPEQARVIAEFLAYAEQHDPDRECLAHHYTQSWAHWAARADATRSPDSS